MKALRCLLATLLLLVFGGGMVFAIDRTEIEPSVVVSADMSAGDVGSDCADKSTVATCSAFGGCVLGVGSFAVSAFPRPACAVYPGSAEHIGGLRGSPEPFPPKPRILA